MKTLQLYTKIIDSSSYIESCQPFEQIENQKILVYISTWLNRIKDDIDVKILPFYQYPHSLTDTDNEFLYENLKEKCEAFKEITENFQYIPIQAPFFTLKSMIDEISADLPDEFKISNIIFKNISEFNFTESSMKQPTYDSSTQREINNSVGSIPVVHSMSVTYHFNPLMWPLIFHEYGHSIFKNLYNTSEFEKIIKTINTANAQPDLKKDQDTLLICISEVFSDLFALNYYSKNYFFAFYFHEMLCSDINDLFNLNAVNIYNDVFQEHPPPIIRMQYLYKEMKKKNLIEDDVLKRLKQYNEFLLSAHSEKIEKIPKPDRDLYDLIYTEVSSLFDRNNPHEFEPKQIDEMFSLLKDKLPIGTLYKNNTTSLESALSRKGIKKFDLETENRIIDIVYTGWKYLILHLFDELYSKSDKNQIENFSREYKFFMKNLCYSIDTSVIVSGYLRENDASE